MDSSELRLVCPKSHDIRFTLEGVSFSQPLSGSAVLTLNPCFDLPDLTELRVCLIRSVSNASQNDTEASSPLLGWLQRRVSWSPSQPSSQSTRSCSIIEDLTVSIHRLHECHVGNDPNRGKIFNVPFSIPISVNTPGTTTTTVGRISYTLVAYLNTTDGHVVGTSEPISLHRQIIPERESIEQTLTYPNSKAVSKIWLEQHMKTNTSELSKIPVDIRILLRRPIGLGGRPTEFQCVAIRGVRWHIEQTTKIIEHQGEECLAGTHGESNVSTCEVASGSQMGYWSVAQNPLARDQRAPEPDDSPLKISLDINLPPDTTIAHEVDLSSYSLDPSRVVSESLPPLFRDSYTSTSTTNLAITVEHRLVLDLTITEDTFDARTMDLVDRKPLRVISNGSFPLYIFDTYDSALEAPWIQGDPPRYDEVPQAPPLYEPHV